MDAIYTLVLGGLGLLLFVAPGLLAAWGLFPADTLSWRLAVGSILSLVLGGLLVLALSALPGGLTFASTMVSLVLMNLILGLLIFLSRRVLLRRQRRSQGPGADAATADARVDSAPDPERVGVIMRIRRISAPTVLAGAALLGFVLFLPVVTQGKSISYTEFSLGEATANTAPWRHPIPQTAPVAVTIQVVSHEGQAASFTIDLVADGAVLKSVDLGRIAAGAGVQVQIALPARGAPAQRFDVLLWKAGIATPYRQIFFWVKAPPGATQSQAPASPLPNVAGGDPPPTPIGPPVRGSHAPR